MPAADLAESDGAVAQDARARRLGRLKALSDEGDLDVEALWLLAQLLSAEGALEEAGRKAVADALEDVGAREHLAERWAAGANRRLHLLPRVGPEHRAVAGGLVRASDGALKLGEEAVVGEGAKVAPHGPAVLVQLTLVELGLALGNAGAEGGNVVREHLCFFGKELWLGADTTSRHHCDFNFFNKTKIVVFVLFCLRVAALVPAGLAIPAAVVAPADAHPGKLAHITARAPFVLFCCAGSSSSSSRRTV